MSNLMFQGAAGGFGKVNGFRGLGFGALPPGAIPADLPYEAIYDAGKAAIATAMSRPDIFSGYTGDAIGELSNLATLMANIDAGYVHLSSNGGWAPLVADEVRIRTQRVLAFIPGSVITPPPVVVTPPPVVTPPVVTTPPVVITPPFISPAPPVVAAPGFLSGTITLPIIGAVSKMTALLIGGAAAFFLLGDGKK